MNRGKPTPRIRQTGVALITAILLVAIATLLAAKMTWDNQLNIRRTETTLMQEQARMFALGAESVSIEILRKDNNAFDYPCDDWAYQIHYGCEGAFPLIQEVGIEELVLGEMEGKLFDAQGKLNVNNLIQPNVEGPNETVKQIFERLFDTLGIDRGLVDAIIDWIDADTVPTGLGAEDGTYTALDPPYRPANGYMTSISELRAVNGVDDEIFRILEPHITAIDPEWCGNANGLMPVNMNFATAEVLGSLHEDLTLGQGQSWVSEREVRGWETVDEIIGLPETLNRNLITVESNCITLNVTVSVGSSVLTMYSLLDRKTNEAILVRTRAFGLD